MRRSYWRGKLTTLLTKSPKETSEKYGIKYQIAANWKHQMREELLATLTTIRSNLMEQQPVDNEKVELINRLIKALEENDITPEQVGEIERITVSSYQVCTKGEDGEPNISDLSAIKMQYIPSREAGSVEPARPTRIYPVKSRPKPFKEEVVMIMPDSQHGYYRYPDGTWEASHDEGAIDVALQIAKYLQPDRVIFGGDMIDFPTLSKFETQNIAVDTMQKSVDSLYSFLSKVRANAPDAKMVYLSGNHENRLTKTLNDTNGDLTTIRQACSGGYPVNSIPHLLRFDDLGVEYVPSWTAGRYMINDNLQVIHGTQAKQSGRTAGAVVAKEQISTIFNHTHRRELAERTINMAKNGQVVGKIVVAASFGTLARIDGAVQSYYAGLDLDQHPVRNFENWQQGVGVVFLRKTGAFAFNAVAIEPDTKEAYFDGQIFKPNV